MIAVSRLSRSEYAGFEGRGGLYRAGRWHEQGQCIVYAAQSEALAALEVLVHLSSITQMPEYVCVRAKIPDQLILDIRDLGPLPTDWASSDSRQARRLGTHLATYDAFNRLVQVVEAPGNGQYTTNYLYDVLDDLKGVCQGSAFDSNSNCPSGGLGRSFAYDSLRRLTSATNPESGTIGYSYDDNGNLLTKTDARGWITCYGAYSSGICNSGYDEINRLKMKTYANNAAFVDGVSAPSVTWVWDAVSKGHLSSVTATSSNASLPFTSSTQYSAYDAMGRVVQSAQTTNGTGSAFQYSYNLAGTLESETYPSERTVKTCYEAAGRALSVTGTLASSQSSTSYASNVLYAPHGAIQQISRGDTLTEVRGYNNRLQQNAMSLGTTGNPRSVLGRISTIVPIKGLPVVPIMATSFPSRSLILAHSSHSATMPTIACSPPARVRPRRAGRRLMATTLTATVGWLAGLPRARLRRRLRRTSTVTIGCRLKGRRMTRVAI